MVRVFAYCDKRYEVATRKAAGDGAIVVTCPPVAALDWQNNVTRLKRDIESAGLVYFNLHADPALPYWFESGGDAALHESALRALNLSYAVIYLVNCYAGGPMLEALKATQPRAIIAGAGENFGGSALLAGADLLGLWLRRGLQLGLSSRAALALAKARLRLSLQTPSIQDALQFEVVYASPNMS